MMNHRLCEEGFCMRGLLARLTLLGCFSTAVIAGNNITGSVRNQSRGQPAAGDEVILLRLDTGTPEETRAKTDSQGMVTLHVQFPDKPYLLRVIHQGVSYDQQAIVGRSLSIEVFDAAPKVHGVTGTIEILRTGTNGRLLHVSDLLEINNASNPPLTQAGERTLEVYLPAKAKIGSVLAAGPGTLAMAISAAPAGEPGHFTVSFPLRPGSTKFAFNYDLPYRGRARFHPKLVFPVQQLAVMIPSTMKFSSPSSAFEILATGNSRYQVHAANQLKAGEGPEFEVSGTGALLPLADQATSQQRFPSPASPTPTASPPTRVALPYLPSIDPRLKQSQPPSESLVLAGVTAVLLASGALLVWRGRKARSCLTTAARLPSSTPLRVTAPSLKR
jgi:hypothetical protein